MIDVAVEPPPLDVVLPPPDVGVPPLLADPVVLPPDVVVPLPPLDVVDPPLEAVTAAPLPPPQAATGNRTENTKISGILERFTESFPTFLRKPEYTRNTFKYLAAAISQQA